VKVTLKPLISTLAFLLVFMLGAYLRLQGLDTKFYWRDEVSTSFVVTGHSYSFIGAALDAIEGQRRTTGEVLSALEQNPDTNPLRLLRDLWQNDPQHLPFYFLVAQQWTEFFGADAPALRLLAAMFGILSLPLFTWLCFELFGSLKVALIGLTLVSLSPLHLIYSQQNREYSLWFAATVFSAATLVWVQRRPNKKRWAVYAISVFLGSFAFLFFIPCLLCHAVYQWTANRQLFKTFSSWLLLGVAPVSPWLINIVSRSGDIANLNEWSNAPLTLKVYGEGLLVVVARLYLDLNVSSFSGFGSERWVSVSAIIALCIFSATAVASLLRERRREGVLVAMLTLLPLVTLIGLDLKGGRHALVSRHLVVTWVGLYLASAWLIGRSLKSRFASAALFVAIIGAEIVSLKAYLPAREWWAYSARDLTGVAATLRAKPDPLLVVAHPFSSKQLVSLSYELGREFPMIVVSPANGPALLNAMNGFAILTRNEEFIGSLKASFDLQKISHEMYLVEKK
jgi:uncharacterized membrane protein